MKKKTSRALSLVLAVIFVIALFPTFVAAASKNVELFNSGGSSAEYDTIAAAHAQAGSGDYIVLYGEETLTEPLTMTVPLLIANDSTLGTGELTIPSGKTLTLTTGHLIVEGGAALKVDSMDDILTPDGEGNSGYCLLRAGANCTIGETAFVGSNGPWTVDSGALAITNYGDSPPQDSPKLIFEVRYGEGAENFGKVTIKTDHTLPEGAKLIIEAGCTLDVAAGATFTNSGTVTNNGTLTNNGTITENEKSTAIVDITNSGTITNNGTIESSAMFTHHYDVDNDGAYVPHGTVINNGTLTESLVDYKVTYIAAGGSMSEYGNMESRGQEGTFLRLSAATRSGYVFKGWSGTEKALENLPADNVFTAQWALSASAPQTYTVTATAGANGKIAPGQVTVTAGGSQVFSIIADTGYYIDTLRMGPAGSETLARVDLLGPKLTLYNFITNAIYQDTRIEVTFKAPFNDVTADDWFESAAVYCHGHDIMTGTGENTFSGLQIVDRASNWQILQNLDGISPVKPPAELAAWQPEKARAWAMEIGVTDGAGAANDVTREQMITMLYRYAQYCKLEVSAAGMTVREYRDYGKISSWALEAMTWAVDAGIIRGDRGLLDPQGTATRAEAAQLYMNYNEHFTTD